MTRGDGCAEYARTWGKIRGVHRVKDCLGRPDMTVAEANTGDIGHFRDKCRRHRQRYSFISFMGFEKQWFRVELRLDSVLTSFLM